MSRSTPSRSRRQPSPAVFRRRRLIAALLTLILVGGIVAVVLWQPWKSWGSGGDAGSPAPVASAPSRGSSGDKPETASTPGTEAPDESASPAPTATPSASPGASARPCTTGDIAVLAVTDKETYGGSDRPKVSISLTNEGLESCLMDVGTATQVFEISSGEDVWWRSTDCQSESSNHVVQLEPGQTVSSSTPLEWDRTRSHVDTCDGDRPRARAGYYNLTVSIGGMQAADARQFILR